MGSKRIHSALISVFDKTGLEPLVRKLHELGIVIYSTGGTADFIDGLDIPVVSVETITDYPSILGGRVKTLHPKIFGGILAIRNPDHLSQLSDFKIPLIDLVIVDLYPFEKTLEQTQDHHEIIEKIDIGGVSLIRAAAKNFNDVVVIPSVNEYELLKAILENNGISDYSGRKELAALAFEHTTYYDKCIYSYLAGAKSSEVKTLRYGENPHQKARFIGNLNDCFEILSGKELSYNNLLDVDAGLRLMREFEKGLPCFAILKHNNVCGIAVRDTLKQAWIDALAGDPVSAFGGVLFSNKAIDTDTAKEIDDLFFEILVAPDYNPEAFEILTKKKNRILLSLTSYPENISTKRSVLNGILEQDTDLHHCRPRDLELKSKKESNAGELQDMVMAVHCVKHLKSNAIALIKNQQLIGMGCGQTSRVDACHQAIHKAKAMGFDTNGSSMASEAFFPFPDCVELAGQAGITAIVQPGGSINDQKSINKADELGISLYFTGIRHFKH